MKKKYTSLTDQEVEKLEKIEEETGLTCSEHIRRAIDDYIEKYERKKG